MSDQTGPTRRATTLSAVSVLAFSGGAALMLPAIARYRLWLGSTFYGQFARIEPWWLAISVAGSLWLLAISVRNRHVNEAEYPTTALFRPPRRANFVAAGAVLGVTFIGTYLIFHAFYFADDEYSAWVQAVIFAKGKAVATTPGPWCQWVGALTPTSIVASGCHWSLSFLPIHSLIRSMFIALGVDHLGGPATAGVSVMLLGAIGTKLWPGRPDRTLLAVLTLALSTQFLVMSMTMWAMPTHLLFSLVWLWLFVEDSRWSLALLPWVGVAALGVHSPLPHGFWAVGLLIRYPWEKRWLTTAYIAGVYVLGLMFWNHWLAVPPAVAPLIGGSVVSHLARADNTLRTVLTVFQVPDLLYRVTAVMNLALLQTWNTPIALASAIAAIVMWPRLQLEMRYIAMSFVFMLLARVLYPENQGEGWGYRYAYTGLVNLALLAAVGVDVLRQAIGRKLTIHVLAASATFSVIALPLRGIQVEHIVRPYWKASELMAHAPGEVVVYPWHTVLWGRQLLRNDPFMRNKPKIMGLYELPPAKMDPLLTAFPGEVTFVQPSELQRLGLPMEPSIDSLRKLVQ